MLAYSGLAESVLHSQYLYATVVHPQPYMLKPRVGLVQVVHLDRGLKKCQKREEGIKNTLHTTD